LQKRHIILRSPLVVATPYLVICSALNLPRSAQRCLFLRCRRRPSVLHGQSRARGSQLPYYGVATISMLLKIIALFCRISFLLCVSFAKETYNFKEPTNGSHPIVVSLPPSTWSIHGRVESFEQLSTFMCAAYASVQWCMCVCVCVCVCVRCSAPQLPRATCVTARPKFGTARVRQGAYGVATVSRID